MAWLNVPPAPGNRSPKGGQWGGLYIRMPGGVAYRKQYHMQYHIRSAVELRRGRRQGSEVVYAGCEFISDFGRCLLTVIDDFHPTRRRTLAPAGRVHFDTYWCRN